MTFFGYLAEEYEAGRSPIQFGNWEVSLEELKKLRAVELLGKDVFLLRHPLDIRLRAVGSFCRDYLDKINPFLDRKIIPVYESLEEIDISLEISLAKSSMINYFNYIYEDSAYDVLNEYAFCVFSPIYDGC